MQKGIRPILDNMPGMLCETSKERPPEPQTARSDAELYRAEKREDVCGKSKGTIYYFRHYTTPLETIAKEFASDEEAKKWAYEHGMQFA